MSRTNIKTGTSTVGADAYEKLPVFASNVLTILSAGRDLYVCCGVASLEDATDAKAFLLPAGAAFEMQPVPQGEIYVKTSIAGPITYWYA